MALRNLGIEHEVVAIAEIDKYAIKSYEAIHGPTCNYGDITKIDIDKLPDFDLFTYSFPCQDISIAGEQRGLDKDSNTRSSLLWDCEKIIRAKKPKFLLMENVKNLIGKKHIDNFKKWLEILAEEGYTNYYKVLNAKDFGIPQNRERVFVVSILGEHKPYIFPNKEELVLRLKDVLEDEVDEKYYLNNEKAEQLVAMITEKNNITNPTVVDASVNEPKTKEVMNTIIARYDSGIQNYKSVGGAVIEPEIKQVGNTTPNPKRENPQTGRTYDADGLAPTLATGSSEQFGVGYMDGLSKTLKANKHDISVLEGIPIKNATSKGYLIAKDGDGVDLAYPTSRTRRGRVQEDISQTLTTDDSKGVVEAARKLAKKARPNDDIEVSVSENGDIRPHRTDVKKSGIQELNINHENNPSHTVTTNHMPKVYGTNTGYRIRKLTPLECWRLMGVDDSDFYKAREENSNTQLYKQAGNAIVVDVLEAIFKNLFLKGELR